MRDSPLPEKTVCLLTGGPGVGKTTIIKDAVLSLSKEAIAGKGVRAGGFYTEETREHGQRQGFRIVTLDGDSAVLASVAFPGPHRVGRYGVDVAALERVGVASLRRVLSLAKGLAVIDEIGKMELLSFAFREVVLHIIESGMPMLATIMLSPHPFADDIKARPQCLLLELTRANREQVAHQVRAWLALSAAEGLVLSALRTPCAESAAEGLAQRAGGLKATIR